MHKWRAWHVAKDKILETMGTEPRKCGLQITNLRMCEFEIIAPLCQNFTSFEQNSDLRIIDICSLCSSQICTQSHPSGSGTRHNGQCSIRALRTSLQTRQFYFWYVEISQSQNAKSKLYPISKHTSS